MNTLAKFEGKLTAIGNRVLVSDMYFGEQTTKAESFLLQTMEMLEAFIHAGVKFIAKVQKIKTITKSVIGCL